LSELLKVNVSEHCEKKNGLTYLSWAWAWSEVLKVDPQATWEAVEFNGLPMCVLPDTSAMVKTIVTINGHAKSCWLPVMNHKNQAIKEPDAFAINTALVRCLTKTISMHGLGLYIYAGEDLPEAEAQVENDKELAKTGAKRDFKVSGPDEAFQSLQPEEQDRLRKIAEKIVSVLPDTNRIIDLIDLEQLDNDQKAGLWSLLDSKTRSAIKAAQAAPKV
jgi:hypothetical protein